MEEIFMQQLKVSSAELVQGASAKWVAITFENYPRQLCINILRTRGENLLKFFMKYGKLKTLADIVGEEFLLAELPTRVRSCDYLCWEPITTGSDRKTKQGAE
jgi:hypothetical protein